MEILGNKSVSLRSIIRKHPLNLIIWVLLCGGLYLTSLYSYVLFHIVAESFSIIIAFSLFTIAWNTRRLAKNNYVLFLSIAFLFAGLIDFVHTLAYKGMGIFQGFDANLPTQLWIIARYLQSLSLLAAPWFIDRKPNIRTVFGFYLVTTILLLTAVFSGTLFPNCFIEGQGLTPFKIVSEYVICLILFISLAFLLSRSKKFDPQILHLMVGSILFTIISELAFTFYISVYGLSNLIGHYFKIFAFYLVYRAIIVTGLDNPYSLLFYDLQKNREELQMIIDASPIMIFYKDRESRFIRVNKALTEATGLHREEIEGKTDFDIYPDQARSYEEDDKEVIASGKSKTGIIEQLDTAQSGQRWLQTDKIPYRDINGSVIGIIGFSIDITERKQAEDALLNSEQKLKAVLYGSPIPQFVIDRDHRVIYWNSALEEITGIKASEVIGTNKHWQAFYDTERPCLADLMADGAIEGINELYQGKYGKSKLVDGAYEATDYFPTLGEEGKWLFFTAVVIKDVNGQVIGALETLEDVTERKQAEEEILTLSITDQLTGLHNRRGFITVADQQLKLSDRTKRGMLLFFADLDGMKGINDTLGHEEGDRVLMEAAAILKETFRAVDIVARMGGDEFAILAIDSTEVNSEIFSTRLQERIDAHNQQENRRYRLSLSVGCACYDPENPCSLDELIVRADRLMYENKRIKKSYR